MRFVFTRIAAMAAAIAVMICAAAEGGAKSDTRFTIGTEADAELLMICPAHAHGTADEAMAKLKQLLAAHPATQRSAIWVCRSNQADTLSKFAPLVDEVYINPFAVSDTRQPDPQQHIWRSLDHPSINQIRRLRSLAPDTRLIACINIEGEPRCWKKRAASFEEVQWMFYAVIGAGYKGIVLRGDVAACPFAPQLRNLEKEIMRFASDLGVAQPVAWVTGPREQPVSAVRSDKMLFVALLNPSYVQIDHDKQTAVLPVKPGLCEGVVDCRLPSGLKIVSGATLSGEPLKLDVNDSLVKAPYSFRSGGEIIVLRLAGNATTQTNEKEPSTTNDTGGK